jgi:hypothetical protein
MREKVTKKILGERKLLSGQILIINNFNFDVDGFILRDKLNKCGFHLQ